MRFSAVGKPAGCKLLRIDAEIEDGIVIDLAIRGDFFAIPEEAFEGIEARLRGTSLDSLANRFDALLAEEGVAAFGISGAAVEEVIREAMRRA